MPEPTHAAGDHRSVHIPVLLRETIHHLQLEPGLVVVDGTVGGAGHSREIIRHIPGGRLLGIDRDPMMLDFARRALEIERNRAAVSDQSSTVPVEIQLVLGSYANFDRFLDDLAWPRADRVLVDLGLSSDQLDDRERGFSFQSEGPLDLRFNPEEGVSAAEWLAGVSEDELARVLRDFAEEPRAEALARALVQARRRQAIHTASQLARVVVDSSLVRTSRESRTHPATRVFQALRIVVNQELEQVTRFLETAVPQGLKSGGYLAVITFHSLEDRLVKHAFRESQKWHQLTPRPVAASTAEQRLNPRSRTAQLRVAKKL